MRVCQTLKGRRPLELSRLTRFRLTVAKQKGYAVQMNVVLIQPLVALCAGLLILIMPRLLNYIVAIYLIVAGISGLWFHTRV